MSVFSNAIRLATHPRMAGRYGVWLGCKLVGTQCSARLPSGGSITGFRRFSDYWSPCLPTSAEFNLLRHMVQPNAVIADIGANIGSFTVTMSRLEPSARILAFEPLPSTAELLRANIQRNQLVNVEALQIAIAAAPGKVQFTDDLNCSARNHLVTVGAQQHSTPVVSVEVTSLDTFCEERRIASIDFAKVDTEGAETQVLRGAASMLQQRRIGAILMEVCQDHLRELGSSVHELVDVAGGYGYSFYEVQPDGCAGQQLSLSFLERASCINALLKA